MLQLHCLKSNTVYKCIYNIIYNVINKCKKSIYRFVK